MNTKQLPVILTNSIDNASTQSNVSVVESEPTSRSASFKSQKSFQVYADSISGSFEPNDLVLPKKVSVSKCISSSNDFLNSSVDESDLNSASHLNQKRLERSSKALGNKDQVTGNNASLPFGQHKTFNNQPTDLGIAFANMLLQKYQVIMDPAEREDEQFTIILVSRIYTEPVDVIQGLSYALESQEPRVQKWVHDHKIIMDVEHVAKLGEHCQIQRRGRKKRNEERRRVHVSAEMGSNPNSSRVVDSGHGQTATESSNAGTHTNSEKSKDQRFKRISPKVRSISTINHSTKQNMAILPNFSTLPMRPPKLEEKKIRSIRSNSTNDSGVMSHESQGSTPSSQAGSTHSSLKQVARDRIPISLSNPNIDLDSVGYSLNQSTGSRSGSSNYSNTIRPMDCEVKQESTHGSKEIDPWNLSSLSTYSVQKETKEMVAPPRTTSLSCNTEIYYDKPLPRKVSPVSSFSIIQAPSCESIDDFKGILNELDDLVRELKDMISVGQPSKTSFESKITEIIEGDEKNEHQDVKQDAESGLNNSYSTGKSSFVNNLPKIDEETSSDESQEVPSISPVTISNKSSCWNENEGSTESETKSRSTIGTNSIVERIIRDNRENDVNLRNPPIGDLV